MRFAGLDQAHWSAPTPCIEWSVAQVTEQAALDHLPRGPAAFVAVDALQAAFGGIAEGGRSAAAVHLVAGRCGGGSGPPLTDELARDLVEPLRGLGAYAAPTCRLVTVMIVDLHQESARTQLLSEASL
jgi:hypothetical protein